MSSSREFIIDEELKMEEGLNYGMNFITEFEIDEIPFTFNADFYHTRFINQVIVDLDRDPGSVYFYNLDGESYSNAFQTDIVFTPFDNFDITTAYRFNDVKMTFNGELMQKPMVSRHKGFLNLSYAMLDAGWNFDYTIQYNGGGRLPDTDSNPERYQLPDRFDPFIIMMMQITKKFENFEIYAGSENLTNHRQANPILGADDPFGQYFDSSMIWAPVFGRVIYLGVRVDMDY